MLCYGRRLFGTSISNKGANVHSVMRLLCAVQGCGAITVRVFHRYLQGLCLRAPFCALAHMHIAVQPGALNPWGVRDRPYLLCNARYVL
jgi:hypothetical protein